MEICFDVYQEGNLYHPNFDSRGPNSKDLSTIIIRGKLHQISCGDNSNRVSITFAHFIVCLLCSSLPCNLEDHFLHSQ